MSISMELTTGRQFRLWDYSVSHSNLLIRSPIGPGIEDCIDIIFLAVDYVELPTQLDEIVVQLAPDDVVQALRRKLGDRLSRDSKVWLLQGAAGTFMVAAANLKIQKHAGELFEIPYLRAPF